MSMESELALEARVRELEKQLAETEQRAIKAEKIAVEVREEANQKLSIAKQLSKSIKSKLDELSESVRLSDSITQMILTNAPIEQQLHSFSSLTGERLSADCKIYSFDSRFGSENPRFFTGTANGERTYITPQASSLIKEAFDTRKPVRIDDNGELFGSRGITVGDRAEENDKLNNALIVPLIGADNSVLGITVIKDKEDGFSDADTKELTDGRLSMSLCSGLQSAKLMFEATTDKLTQLQNRNGLEKFVKSDNIDFFKGNTPCCVAMLDIDKFKRFNDTYGHDIGDEVLKKVANVLLENVRASQNIGVFRFGGEEILVVLPTDVEAGTKIVERMRDAVSKIELSVPEHITISGGVANFDEPMRAMLSSDELINSLNAAIKKADAGLYYSKEHGRNQTTNFEKLSAREQAVALNANDLQAKGKVNTEKVFSDKSNAFSFTQDERNVERRGGKPLDFRFALSTESPVIASENGVSVKLDVIGSDLAHRLTQTAMRTGIMDKEIAEIVDARGKDESDLNGYYDTYVNYDKDGNLDNVEIVTTFDDGTTKPVRFEPDFVPNGLSDAVKTAVEQYTGTSIDTIINDMDKSDMDGKD